MHRGNEKYIDSIRKNMQQIREYLSNLSYDEINKAYKDLREVLYFYGYKNKGVNYLLNYFTSDHAIEEARNLPQLEEVTNAILFHLKYK